MTKSALIYIHQSQDDWFSLFNGPRVPLYDMDIPWMTHKLHVHATRAVENGEFVQGIPHMFEQWVPSHDATTCAVGSRFWQQKDNLRQHGISQSSMH